jgi:hypothetical protein
MEDVSQVPIGYGQVPIGYTPRVYGEGVKSLGGNAVDLLYELCDVPTQSESQRWRWVRSDWLALHDWAWLEDGLPDAFNASGMGDHNLAKAGGLVSEFTCALPFDEAERRWLSQTYLETPEGPNRISELRALEPNEIASRGLWRVVESRELLRRWWAWRRDYGEFEKKGTLVAAREALADMVVEFTDHDLPDNYHAMHHYIKQPSPTKPPPHYHSSPNH